MIRSSRAFVHRFAVIEGEKIASSIWRIWKAKNSDDVYITTKNLGSMIKLSFHANGYCQLAATKESSRGLISANKPRPVFTGWHRHGATKEKIVLVASLFIAPEFLLPWAAAEERGIQWLSSPERGKAYFFFFIFTRIPRSSLLIGEEIIIQEEFSLDSGENFFVLRCLKEFNFQNFLQDVDLTFKLDQVKVLSDVGGPGLRALIWNEPDDIVELRLADFGGEALDYIRIGGD